jgi:hypothetical protein
MRGDREIGRTVYSDGHCLCQDVSICANKGRDFPQWIELEVFEVLDWRLRVDKLNVQVVGLCNSQQNGCPPIFLKNREVSPEKDSGKNRLCCELRSTRP